MKITAENVRIFVDYDPETGRFIWKKRAVRTDVRNDANWNVRFAGKIVAERAHRHGHMQIGLFCRNYMAHRIAWMHFYGEDPGNDLDHINGVPGDNRICNLRRVTKSQNLMNSKIRIDNTSGVKGVARDKKGWQAYITVNKKTKSIGRFRFFEEAVCMRAIMEVMLHGVFARAA